MSGYEVDLKNKPTTKGKKYLLEIPLCEVEERDMIKLIKLEPASATRPKCVKNRVDDMRKLFLSFRPKMAKYHCLPKYISIYNYFRNM